MNKGELVDKVAKECELSKAASEKVLASVLGAITDAIESSTVLSNSRIPSRP